MGEVYFTNKVKLAVAKAADAENEDAVEVIDTLLSQLEEMRERLRQLETAARNVAYATSFFQSQQAEARLRALLSQTDEGERMEGDGE